MGAESGAREPDPPSVDDVPASTEESTEQSTAESSSPSLKSVALPSEHGGWVLTLEPGLLGVLVAPSLVGLCLALAAFVAFLARTPVKIVMVDRWRGRSLPRTRLALRVAVAAVLLIFGLVVVTPHAATGSSWCGG